MERAQKRHQTQKYVFCRLILNLQPWRLQGKQAGKERRNNAGFNSTCYHPPPGHTPGNLQCFSYLAVYSPPPGMQKETIPHPRDSSSTKIDFRTIAQPDVLTRAETLF